MISEFSLEVECPHCGAEQHETAEFNFEESYPSHCNSFPRKVECFECDKDFWFKAVCNFEVEASEISKKKFKGLLK